MLRALGGGLRHGLCFHFSVEHEFNQQPIWGLGPLQAADKIGCTFFDASREEGPSSLVLGTRARLECSIALEHCGWDTDPRA